MTFVWFKMFWTVRCIIRILWYLNTCNAKFLQAFLFLLASVKLTMCSYQYKTLLKLLVRCQIIELRVNYHIMQIKFWIMSILKNISCHMDSGISKKIFMILNCFLVQCFGWTWLCCIVNLHNQIIPWCHNINVYFHVLNYLQLLIIWCLMSFYFEKKII